MGMFEKAIEKIVDVKLVKSSWYFEPLAQFCQANHFMTGWGLGVQQMRNMSREEITRWWNRCQNSFQQSFIKRMTYRNDEVDSFFLPLLPQQKKICKETDKQIAKLRAEEDAKKAQQQAKQAEMARRNKSERNRHAVHEQRNRKVHRKKPTHLTVRNGQEVEVV